MMETEKAMAAFARLGLAAKLTFLAREVFALKGTQVPVTLEFTREPTAYYTKSCPWDFSKIQNFGHAPLEEGIDELDELEVLVEKLTEENAGYRETNERLFNSHKMVVEDSSKAVQEIAQTMLLQVAKLNGEIRELKQQRDNLKTAAQNYFERSACIGTFPGSINKESALARHALEIALQEASK